MSSEWNFLSCSFFSPPLLISLILWGTLSYSLFSFPTQPADISPDSNWKTQVTSLIRFWGPFWTIKDGFSCKWHQESGKGALWPCNPLKMRDSYMEWVIYYTLANSALLLPLIRMTGINDSCSYSWQRDEEMSLLNKAQWKTYKQIWTSKFRV